MNFTIRLPDTVQPDKVVRLIRKIEETCVGEGISVKIDRDTCESGDAWEKLDFDAISVDAGIDDLAENHDHYLYGSPKRS